MQISEDRAGLRVVGSMPQLLMEILLLIYDNVRPEKMNYIQNTIDKIETYFIYIFILFYLYIYFLLFICYNIINNIYDFPSPDIFPDNEIIDIKVE